MSFLHWNYFLALEEDLVRLSRYIEINKDNLKTYSIETARILMLASQEVDVLLKQICRKHDNDSDSEQGYRSFISSKYPKILEINIGIPRYFLSYIPFDDWKKDKTPVWWIANNKIKHHRDTEFKKASLDNALDSMAALLLINIYFYFEVKGEKQLYPNPIFLDPHSLVGSITPTRVGMLNIYKLP